MTKKPIKTKQLTPEELYEQNEARFWKEVEAESKNLITNLIEKVLPISAIPAVFDCEKDVDYRVLLRSDLPNFYADNEDYQTKIANESWTAADVEDVSQDLTCAYFDLVVKSLADWLSRYYGFENTTNLSQLLTKD